MPIASDDALLALSPLDGRYHQHTDMLRPIFSEFGLIKYRLIVELKWLMHLAANPDIHELPSFSNEAKAFIERMMDTFSLADAQAIKAIEAQTNHDVKAIEYWIQAQFEALPELFASCPFIHFACTSEDINNVSHALMLTEARRSILLPQLNRLTDTLEHMAHAETDTAMLCRTHGQSATPSTMGKEWMNTVQRLHRQISQLEQQTILAKFNGAVGNYNAHLIAYPTINWPLMNQSFIESLGLNFNAYTTQIEPHDYMAEYFQIIQRTNTILIDFARDTWGYIALGYLSQTSKANEVGSSTMPHKVNPIDFENAEGNLGMANALLQHFSDKLPISRWQRDLSDSTVLRNMGVALGYSHLAYTSLLKGLSKVTANRPKLAADLAEEWALLAEPIQTVMRRYQLPNAYEALKALTRGQSGITQANLWAFIDTLALPEDEKSRLRELTPLTYIGLAPDLAKTYQK